jgi:beta-lactamase class A
MPSLIPHLNALCDAEPYTVTWFFKNLITGETADRAGDLVVPSASTRKIAILMAALAACRAGRLRLDAPFEIEARHQDTDSGVFQWLTPGITITFRDALVMMIIVSDNTCTAKVAELVGLDAINALSRRAGMVGTTHRYTVPPKTGRDHTLEQANTTTAADVGRLLELILQATQDEAVAAGLGVTREDARLALDILLWQRLKSRLPSRLPSEAKVAHKTGTGVGGRNGNDAGIVFQGATPLFILSVFTEHLPVDMPDGLSGLNAANALIGTMAKACYDAVADQATTAGA